MRLEKLERVKTLRSQANSLRGYFDRFDAYLKEKPSCDKHGAQFNGDSRFSNFKVSASFDSWKGYYGNSSCSTAGPGIEQKDAQLYFTEALNIHKAALFDTMADLMTKDAKAMKDEAEAEIQRARELLDSLDHEGERTEGQS